MSKFNTQKILLAFIIFPIMSIHLNAQIEASAFKNHSKGFKKDIKEYSYVAPNPFSDVSYICFSAEENTHYQLVIRNKMGQPVISKSDEVINGDNRIEVFRSGLPADKYFYRLRIGNQVFKNGRLYIVD